MAKSGAWLSLDIFLHCMFAGSVFASFADGFGRQSESFKVAGLTGGEVLYEGHGVCSVAVGSDGFGMGA